jgi:uncharacterized protein (DUF2147 family)
MRGLLIPLLFFVLSGNAQSITGKWKTIDDDTGEERSVVEIYENGGKFFGRIVRLLNRPAEDADPICTACPKDDARHNKKVIGMVIISDMKPSGSSFADGNILDPKNGKIYRCKLWLEDNTLKVRGYWGPFYRTQTWKRLN